MKALKKAELRDIKESHLMLILEWRNRESIRKVMFNSEEITLDQHLKWFENLQKSKTTQSKIFYYENEPYGILNISDIDKKNNKCEWGFYIGANDAPNGMGTILGYISLNYIFRELSMRKLTAKVLSTNHISISFHKKLGFFKEGVLRKHIIKDDFYIDILLFGLFNEEWNEKSEEIQRLIEGRFL